MDQEFSVYQWFSSGQYEEVLRFVDSVKAVQTAIGLSTSVGARAGTTVRVIITDGGDSINWEWLRDVGVAFPKGLEGLLKDGVNNLPNRGA